MVQEMQAMQAKPKEEDHEHERKMQEKLLEILRDTDSDDSSRKEIEKQVSTGPFAVETLAEEYKEMEDNNRVTVIDDLDITERLEELEQIEKNQIEDNRETLLLDSNKKDESQEEEVEARKTEIAPNTRYSKQ